MSTLLIVLIVLGSVICLCALAGFTVYSVAGRKLTQHIDRLLGPDKSDNTHKP